MITQATAGRIWECYREIDAGEKLLLDIAESKQQFDRDDIKHGTLPDAFGRRRQMQLGVPSGDSSHRILGVAPLLAESVIRAHIEHKRAELVEVNEQARIELETPLPQRTTDH